MSNHPRVAIITGGGRGIGRAMTLGLAEAGVRVIVSAARERGEIDSVAAEGERRIGERRIIGELADVTREEDCARLGVTGRRFVATRWRADLPEAEAALAASDDAGWAVG